MKRLSMSRLQQAEACAFSQVIPGVIDVTPYPYRERGTVLHQYLCDVVMLDDKQALERVPEAYREEAAAVDLASLPHADPKAWAVEVAFAYNPTTDTARELHRGGNRDYSMVSDDEVPGTADVVGVQGDELVLLDVKTGRAELLKPREALQLLGLALAGCRAYGLTKAVIGWIRLRDGVPRYEYARLSAEDLAGWVRERVARVVDGDRLARLQWEMAPESVELTVGPHCRFCDAYARCPAQSTLAREVTRAALAEATTPLDVPDEKRPDFYRWVAAIGILHARLVEHLEGLAREKPIPVGGGKVLGPKTDVKEFLNPTLTQTVLLELAVEGQVPVAKELVDEVVTTETKLTASKTALSKAAQRHLPPGKTTKGYVTELLKALRERGATYAVESNAVKLYTPTKPKALPAGEQPQEGEDVPM